MLVRDTPKEKVKVKENVKEKEKVKKAKSLSPKRKRPAKVNAVKTDKSTEAQPQRSKPLGSPFNINISDHPLFNYTDRNQETKSRVNSKFPSRSTRSTRPNLPQVGNRPQSLNRFNKSNKPFRPLRGSKLSEAIELVSKQLNPQDYKPSITNQFLQGKSTSFQISLTSRITSVIKSQLVKSKYPYLLPKSIVESAPTNANKFLVKNVKVKINSDDLKNDIDKIIKGKSVDNLPDDSVISKSLNQNADLNLAAKQTMFNIISAKSLENTFAKAHWKS